MGVKAKNMKFFAWTQKTPQKSEDEKVLKNLGMQRGVKSKKHEGGVFSQTKWVPKN